MVNTGANMGGLVIKKHMLIFNEVCVTSILTVMGGGGLETKKAANTYIYKPVGGETGS